MWESNNQQANLLFLQEFSKTMKQPMAVTVSNSSLNPQYSTQRQLTHQSYEYKKEGGKEGEWEGAREAERENQTFTGHLLCAKHCRNRIAKARDPFLIVLKGLSSLCRNLRGFMDKSTESL